MVNATTRSTNWSGNWTTANGTVSEGPDAGATALSLFLILISSLVTTFGLFFQKIAQERFDYANKTFGSNEEEEEE